MWKQVTNGQWTDGPNTIYLSEDLFILERYGQAEPGSYDTLSTAMFSATFPEGYITSIMRHNKKDGVLPVLTREQVKNGLKSTPSYK